MLGAVCILSCLIVALGQMFSLPARQLEWMDLAVGSDNTVVVTSAKTVYQLDSKLAVLDEELIPRHMSTGCGRSDFPSVSIASNLSLYPEILFVCSTRGAGICEIRSLRNVSTVIHYQSLNNVSSNSTSALRSSLTILGNNGTLLYYVAQLRGLCRQSASVTVLQVNNGMSLQFLEDDELDGIGWSFVGGFSFSRHVYITARQTSERNSISTTESVILRFYNWTMRIKKKLKCSTYVTELKAQTVFDHPDKSKVLLASFSNATTGKSALCMIDAVALQRQFCGIADAAGNCTGNQTSQNEDVILREVEGLIDHVVTSLDAKLSSDGSHMIVYAGTREGKLLRIMIRNMSHVLLSDQHTLSPAVDEIVRLQLLGTNLLALTGNRVLSLPINDCSEATNCTQCSSLKYATFCGWCYNSMSCTLRSKCEMPDILVNSPCIKVVEASPQHIAASKPMPVTVNISGIPQGVTNLHCNFGYGKRTAARIGNSNSYMCTPKENNKFREEIVEARVTIYIEDTKLGESLTQLFFIRGCSMVSGEKCVKCGARYYSKPVPTSMLPTTLRMTTNLRTTASPTVTTHTSTLSVTTIPITTNAVTIIPITTDAGNTTHNQSIAGRRRRSIGNSTGDVTTPTQQLITTPPPVTTIQTTSTTPQTTTTTIQTTSRLLVVATTPQASSSMAGTAAFTVSCHDCMEMEGCIKCQSDTVCDECLMNYMLTDGTCKLAMATVTTTLVSGNATNSTSTANATMPTESSGLSTKLIIIIAASGGGGLVLLIVVVFVCCCVKLKRRGKGSISASGDFVASNNPLRTLAESKSGDTAVRNTSESTSFTGAVVGTASGGHRLPPKPPVVHMESDLYINPDEPVTRLPAKPSHSNPEQSLQPSNPLAAKRSSPAPFAHVQDDMYTAVDDASGHAPLQEDNLYLTMDGRPPSPTEGLPVSDDLYLVVDDKSSAVAHQPVVHTPSDSYVIFTDGSRQSGVPETEDVYLAAYEGERRAPNVKEGARLSRSPTPKKLGIPVPVTKPKAFTLGGAMVDELKRELNSGLLEEDDFYQNLPGRAMTDVHNLQQERRAANRNSGLHPQTSGYEAGGGRDLYENLRRQPISDVKSHSQPQQVSQPPLQMEEIYGNQEVVDMSNMPPTLDVIYGNSDLIEEQVYANT